MPIISRGLGFTVASMTATGANFALDLGFIPAYAKGFMTTTGRTWEWTNGMSGATGGTALVFGYISTNTGTSFIGPGAGGITTLDGSAGTAIGLTIGTDTQINTAGDAWVVVAIEPM
jgi:hypothetical protein